MTEFPMNAFRCQSLTLQKRGPFCSTHRGCRNWSNEFGEDWDSWESTYKWIVEETLFLHTGEPHYWTLMEERQHVLSLITDTPTVKRLSDAAAVEWFVNNGIELPVELRQFHEVAVFKPGPAADPQVNAKHATSAVSSITPQWDSETQEQPSDDLSAPATTPVTPPHSTKHVDDPRGELPRRIVDVLPYQQCKVVQFLWRQATSVSITTLRDACWRNKVEFETVRTTVRRVVNTLCSNDITNVKIVFSETKDAVQLIVE